MEQECNVPLGHHHIAFMVHGNPKYEYMYGRTMNPDSLVKRLLISVCEILHLNQIVFQRETALLMVSNNFSPDAVQVLAGVAHSTLPIAKQQLPCEASVNFLQCKTGQLFIQSIGIESNFTVGVLTTWWTSSCACVLEQFRLAIPIQGFHTR